MSELARSLDAAQAEFFTLDELSKAVCRHIGVSVFTEKDLKRIIRRSEGAEIVGKLLQCAEENMRDERILNGVLMTFRRMLKDAVLGQEVSKQNLPRFAFRCLALDFERDFDVHSDCKQFTKLVIETIFDLSWAAPEYQRMFDQALEGTAKIARTLHRFTDDPAILKTQLKILQRYLSKMNPYKIIKQQPLPPTTLQSLELPALAESLIHLLDNPARPPLHWESLDSASEILCWIAYYQSSAILDLPDKDGSSLFIAFMLSSSMPIRARGVLGLLNLYHNDTAQEIRLCNPHYILYLGKIITPTCLKSMRTPSPLFIRCMNRFNGTDEPTQHTFAERYRNPSVTILSDGTTFDAYETALRVVEYELTGPQNIEESCLYPKPRILGTAEYSPELWDDMEAALRFHGKDYEADILNFNPLFIAKRLILYEDEDAGAINMINAVIQSSALVAIRRWPESCYFHYAWIQSQIGDDYLERVDKQLQSASCTPYFRRQLSFEAALNQFSMGIVRLSVDADATRLHSQIAGEQHMKGAESRISAALGFANPDSPEEKILRILSALTTLVTKMPSLNSNELKTLREDVGTAVLCFIDNRYPEHDPLIRLSATFYIDFEADLRRWGSFIDAVHRVEPAASDARIVGALVELLQFYDKDESVEIEPQIPRSFLKAAGYRQQHRCSYCGRGSLGLRKCARCGKAKYCDKQCQERHWKAGHKAECISPLISA
ncbi:hypothetical protein SISSUDRAFT_1132496 [Sistotremastrum suecicum HHB10207 ss-3]|uniref:MYND-type domain-containing protein n=1 Tax=Sistotremastrum suecicum HHB10207 ss-3 TaxID=1314776 RepID=A0A165YRH7_9AGAM|nr:hypothetical protein SISSUDRAFT_1132496 [Sistotremastrum suecicum HHB10207 ss-3]